MRRIKKITALALCAVMSLSLAACGKKELKAKEGHNENISIGTWWVQYYDSSNESMDEASDWANAQEAEGDDEETKATKEFNRKVYQLKWDNVKKLEDKYNITFQWDNITYTGVKESINTSILAGSPDCDIYLVETSFAIPAQMNGLALDLKTVLPEDHDLFKDQKIMSYLDLGDGKACIIKRVEAQSQVEATYPLGFNMQMLEENGLEDPRKLYEKGEWTWDKFIEYCKALTQDTDGDGQIDQYGFDGYAGGEVFENLMMSNGATIASGTTETLTSAPVGEALKMLQDMYITYNVCAPYDFEGEPHETNRKAYREGKCGFFPMAAWIASDGEDYDYNNEVGYTLPFDVAYVRWPVGPSGNKDTNAGKNATSGEYYIIPANVQEPKLVIDFLYDYWNWFDGDTSIRDDRATLNWWYGVTAKTPELQNANFEVMNDCGLHTEFDLWQSMNVEYDFNALLKGEMTPAQFQETYKQQVQDGIDAFFK